MSPTIHRVYFSDVIFADIFTSYAKVLGDVWLSLYMLLPGGSLLTPPTQYGWYRWVLPTLMRYAIVPSCSKYAVQDSPVFRISCAFDSV
jgi:EXS family